MLKAFETWTVLRHGPIEKLSENLWRVSGSLPGMSLERTMTIVRLGDGRLVIHNGIALEEPLMREIEGWGHRQSSWCPMAGSDSTLALTRVAIPRSA